jgi:hypothetical protein
MRLLPLNITPSAQKSSHNPDLSSCLPGLPISPFGDGARSPVTH